MRLLRNISDLIWEKVFVFCGVLCVLVPICPWNMPSTSKDSGVFLYTGWRILNGELPYRDIWDHKPPAVFYIDALGLAFSNHSRWGVWLVEFVSLFLAGVTGFYLMKKAFGVIAAVLSTMLWMLTLVFVIQGGNLTTEYALPLQFIALWLIYDLDRPDLPRRRYFLIGLTGAIAFFTKQTTIGIWMAIILYLTFNRLISRQIKQGLRELLFISIGGLFVVVFMIIFFGVQGALPQFWSASFEYNLAYSSSMNSFISRLRVLFNRIGPLTQTGLFQVSMVGYIFAIALVLFKRNVISKQLPLLLIGLIDLPLELMLISISGMVHYHYYMTILPVLALFAGIAFWACFSWLSDWEIPNLARFVSVTGIVVILLWSSYADYHDQVIALRNFGDNTAILHVKSATSPNDYVLLWGAESSVNFYAQRRSPTRFVYQYPLYQKGYANAQMIEEFLRDVIKNRPKLIIDTKDRSTPIYKFPVHTQEIDTDIAYLRSHYRQVENLGNWAVYEYAGDTP